MKKVFVHRYRYSHTNKRKKYKKLKKERRAILIFQNSEGWLYGIKDE